MDSLSVGTATAKTGKKDKGFINVGQLSSGLPVKAPVIILNGAKPGPRIWLQACVHGDEYNGTFAILRVLDQIDLKDLAGAVIAVPAVNITAFEKGQRTSPLDYVDLNRAFPGKEIGSFSQQAAKVIFENMITNANYLIDIHSGGSRALVCPHVIFYGNLTEELEKLTKAAGFDIIYGLKGEEFKQSLIAAATSSGILSIMLEAGGGGQIEAETEEAIIQAIKNIMKHLKMIKGEAKMKEGYTILSNLLIMRSRYGGLFEPLVSLKSPVSKGMTLAEVRDLFGEKKADVISPLGGVVVAERVFPLVSIGDVIFEIAHGEIKKTHTDL